MSFEQSRTHSIRGLPALHCNESFSNSYLEPILATFGDAFEYDF